MSVPPDCPGPENCSWPAHERRTYHGWHLKREISVGHIVTTFTIALSGIGYVIQNEKNHTIHSARLDALHALAIELKASDLRQDTKIEGVITRVESRIERIEDKIDSILRRETRIK